jgi:hypothetical protein
MIEILVYLSCTLGHCQPTPLTVTPEAVAIAACESGDTVTLGSYELHARSHTADGGIWQFNDATYLWMNGYTNAELDTPRNQYDSFVWLWRDGKGWRHWASSKRCWDKWLVVGDDDRAVMR